MTEAAIGQKWRSFGGYAARVFSQTRGHTCCDPGPKGDRSTDAGLQPDILGLKKDPRTRILGPELRESDPEP